MFTIETATADTASDAVEVLGDAFADDPLMHYLFRDHANGVRAGAVEFFSLLLRARLALNMPAYVLQQDGRVLGAAMGYDTSRPEWPAPITAEWREFEAAIPHFVSRLAAYEQLCEKHQPKDAHYYLGVIGVHPTLQGKGAGKALLTAFCAPSQSDAKSGGVYLDTTNPDSLEFYYRNGFELLGEGELDAAPLWCVYRRT